MAQPKYKQLSDGAGLLEMFDYFCSKIDFNSSFLDADAVVAMNTLFGELRKIETPEQKEVRVKDAIKRSEKRGKE